MTLIELTVVILVILSLVTILFVGARAWKKGSDRSANLLNIRNCQMAMRGEQNMRQLSEGAAFPQATLQLYMPYPRAVNGEIGAYTNNGLVTPQSNDPADNWNHIWLIPGTAGLPDDLGGNGFGHESIVETTSW